MIKENLWVSDPSTFDIYKVINIMKTTLMKSVTLWDHALYTESSIISPVL